MNKPIKGQRLTNAQSQQLGTQDHDIPVIPPPRIKLESTGPVNRSWLELHANEGDRVEVIKMYAGGDIVRGLVGDDLKE